VFTVNRGDRADHSLRLLSLSKNRANAPFIDFPQQIWPLLENSLPRCAQIAQRHSAPAQTSSATRSRVLAIGYLRLAIAGAERGPYLPLLA